MNLRYLVGLSEGERGELQAMLGGGKHAVRKLKRAQILLAADAGMADETIASSVGVGGSTEREIAAWQAQRNAADARIKWMFTTEKARHKPGRAYPNLDKFTKESEALS